jgi:hypothetical protein
MPFGVAQVVTTVGKAITAKRMFGTTPAQIEPKWGAIGVGATGAARTAAAGDTALSTEVETRGVGVGSNPSNAIFQVVVTNTATANRSVDEEGLFDQLALGGNMFASATENVISLTNGDAIVSTWQTTYT